MQIIKTYCYNSIYPGPRLLILGAIHGNEVCGPPAIRDIISAFEKNEMKPEKGCVTFIPVCNPQAYAENKRFIDHNLNRQFCRRTSPQRYEEHLMNVLAPYLENCDILLDLHSYRAGGPPFVFRGPDAKMQVEEEFASYLGVDHIIYGWHEAYMNSGVELDLEQSVGTTEYVRKHGGIALTLECGQHLDPNAPACALRGIKGALHYSGIVPQPDIKPTKNIKFTRLYQVFFKEQQGTFFKPWTHLEKVNKGEKLAKMEDGTIITAPFEGRIIFPYETGPVGDEWMYMGIDESVHDRDYWLAIVRRKLRYFMRMLTVVTGKILRRLSGRSKKLPQH